MTARLSRGVALAAIVAGSAACSNSGNAAGGGTGSTSAPTTTSSGQSKTGAAAVAAITSAYGTLFNLANPALAPKIAVIQNGATMQGALQSALKSQIAKTAGGAKVVTVTPLSSSSCSSEALPAPCDGVKFYIVSPKGKTLLPDNGFAVYVGGKWLVAKVTICGLLSLAAGGKAPAGC
jgi:hypothetical protein